MPKKNIKIMPAESLVDTSDAWKNIQLEQLDEIMEFGSVQKKYDKSLCRRVYDAMCIAFYCVPLCSPCITCDIVFGCARLVCCNKSECRIPSDCGCGIAFIDAACAETFRSSREETLKECKRRLSRISIKDIKDVCEKYMKKFDQCIAESRPKEANMIRGRVVDILLDTGCVLKETQVPDDGADVDNLKTQISELDPNMSDINRLSNGLRNVAHDLRNLARK